MDHPVISANHFLLNCSRKYSRCKCFGLEWSLSSSKREGYGERNSEKKEKNYEKRNSVIEREWWEGKEGEKETMISIGKERLRIEWKRSLHRKGERWLILYRQKPMVCARRNAYAYVG